MVSTGAMLQMEMLEGERLYRGTLPAPGRSWQKDTVPEDPDHSQKVICLPIEDHVCLKEQERSPPSVLPLLHETGKRGRTEGYMEENGEEEADGGDTGNSHRNAKV